MAKDDMVINLEEDETVVVDISETADAPVDPDVLAEGAKDGAEPPQKKPRVRLKLDGAGEGAVTKPSQAAEEAANALTASLKAAEDRVKAAEATAASERARADANQRASEAAQQEARAAREQVESRELSILTSGIEQAQRALETLQQEQTRQYENGEFGKASALNVEIGKTAAQLDRLEEGKKVLESGAATRKADTGRVEPAQTSGFERWVSQFVPDSQNWLRRHPECAPPEVGGNPAAHAKMMAGHFEAVSKGYTLNTPEYFQTVDAKVTEEPTSPLSAAAAPEPAAASAAAKPRAMPSAPPSREPPTAGGAIRTDQQRVTLSKEQQDAAKMSFPNLPIKEAFAQYAKNLIELTNEGKMGRTTH